MSTDMVHAQLGASKADRWINCPGSIQLSRGVPDVQSRYAAEGQVAHLLAEMSWKSGVDPAHYIGETFDGIDVTEEMAEAVALFHTELTEQYSGRNETGVVFIERKFDLNDLNPPAPMFGTSDAVVVLERARRLIVSDLKYGSGVLVEVVENPQELFYALGALLSYEKEFGFGKIDEIELVVVQPRAFHRDGAVRRWVTSYEELLAFAVKLLGAAKRTLEPNAPLKAGDWCRFCPARALCPALRDHAVAVAQVDFAEPEISPPDPRKLTLPQLTFVLDNAKIIEDWLSSVRTFAQAMLDRGEEVPGYKLVPKRAMRKWRDEAGAALTLETNGMTRAMIVDESLKSPAQIEKVIKQYGSKDKWLPILEGLVVKESSGLTLARDSDPRPAALIGPAHDFADEPAK